MTTTDPKLIERVAWLYEREDGVAFALLERIPADKLADGVTETPLYTAAAINEAAQKERAGVVAWLREQSDEGAEWALGKEKGTTARAAYGGGSFALKRASDAIERGEHLPPPPAIEAKESQHG